MKVITPQLQALFATGQMNFCNLFEFQLVGGSSLYYCSGDVNISVPVPSPYVAEDGVTVYENEAGTQDYVTEGGGGQLYSNGGHIGPYFDRKDNKAKMHCAVGLQVDTLIFDVIPGAAQINGAPFLTAIREGVFDGANLLYSGAYWPAGTYANPVTPTGTILKYLGRVGQVDCSRNLATFTVNSYLELLNQNMPVNLFQGGCVNSLYDASCTLNSANFTTNSTALTGSTVGMVNANLTQETGYFSLGTITFTSGANEGISRTIKLYTQSSPSTLTMVSPLPSAPANGDTFNIFPGCDKQQSTCAIKFANLQNFRGFPYVPDYESAS